MIVRRRVWRLCLVKVLVKNVRDKGGTGKLRSSWEQNIYEVVSKHEDIPVYKIKPVGDNRVRTIHRNLLKLCNELPLDVLEKPIDRKEKVRKGVVSVEDSEDELVIMVKRNGRDTHFREEGREDQGREDQRREDQGREDQGREDQGREDQGREDQGREDQGREDQGREDFDGMGESEPGEEVVCRRSARNRKPKRIFTYNKFGGNPVNEETISNNQIKYIFFVITKYYRR